MFDTNAAPGPLSFIQSKENGETVAMTDLEDSGSEDEREEELEEILEEVLGDDSDEGD